MIPQKVIGADACNGRLVCISLDYLPSREEIGEIYREKSGYFDVDVSAKGLAFLLSLKPDVIVLEPTGINYVKFWVTKCGEAGVKVALVGHRESNRYRDNLKLPDKDDEADALALACYYHEHHADPLQFARIRDETTSQLRDCALRLKHIDRIQSPLINRLQQDLAWAMPEVKGSISAVLFWRWLAGCARSAKYDRLAIDTCGLGLTPHMRSMAKLLVDLWHQQSIIESEMMELLKHPQFDRDRAVMNRYYLSPIAQAIIISQYYPISNFLGNDGLPIVQRSKSRKTGKVANKPVSLRRFRKTLGVAPVRVQSGKSPSKTKKAGSKLCRCQFWLWILRAFELKKSKIKHATPFMEELNDLWLTIKATKHIKVARSTFASKVAEMLFYDLISTDQ
jgi:transposase